MNQESPEIVSRHIGEFGFINDARHWEAETNGRVQRGTPERTPVPRDGQETGDLPER